MDFIKNIMSLEILLIIVLSVIIIYSTNLSKSYPEKLIELMKEKFIILLLLLVIYYFIYTKKYTIAILVSIIFSFLLMDIPVLTETFLDDFGVDIDSKQQELFKEIEKLNNSDIAETLSGGTSMKKMKEDLKDVDKLLNELETKNN